jgi:hypothetical protein
MRVSGTIFHGGTHSAIETYPFVQSDSCLWQADRP